MESKNSTGDGDLALSLGLLEIVVEDLDAAIDWYTDVLGLLVIDHLVDDRWCLLRFHGFGGAAIALWQPDEGEFVKGGVYIPILMTDDIHFAVDRMKRMGVEFTEEVRSVGRSNLITTFLDCEGNILQLMQ